MRVAAISSAAVGRTHDRQMVVRLSEDLYARLVAHAKSEAKRTGYTVTVADVIRSFAAGLPAPDAATTDTKPRKR